MERVPEGNTAIESGGRELFAIWTKGDGENLRLMSEISDNGRNMREMREYIGIVL